MISHSNLLLTNLKNTGAIYIWKCSLILNGFEGVLVVVQVGFHEVLIAEFGVHIANVSSPVEVPTNFLFSNLDLVKGSQDLNTPFHLSEMPRCPSR